MRVAFFHLGQGNFGVELLSASLKRAGYEVRLFWERIRRAVKAPEVLRLCDIIIDHSNEQE